MSWQGNWETFTDDDNEQTRTHNAANEITSINSSAAKIGHDAAGNMTKAGEIEGR